MCQICGQPSTIRCNCEVTQPFCDQCGDDSKCIEKMDAQCVIYHLNSDEPSELTNLGMDNGANLEDILEAIDDLIGSQFNIPFTPNDTNAIKWAAGGTANHSPTADVAISPDALNQLEIRPTGLYAKPFNEEYKVKVNSSDLPAYLKDQIIGATDDDGIVSVDVTDQAGIMVAKPSLNILALLNKIKVSYPDAFCELVNEVCASFGWVADELTCLIEDFTTTETNTANDLPEPFYSFIDNNTLYFVSQANSTGKLWSINPYTYVNNADIVYVNETRSGEPYGPGNGTYVAGAPYRGNGISPYVEPSNIGGAYYDAATRTLFVHGNKTFGSDYYDFNTNTWGKVTISGSVTSAYNTTANTDAFTHVIMASNPGTNLIATGWGTNSGNRGTIVILIDKVLRQVVAQRDSIANPIVGTSSNPFKGLWFADIAPDNSILVGKGQSEYRNVAVLNPDFTLKQELVLPISTIGRYGLPTLYTQSFFYDSANDKIYANDVGGFVLYVYSKSGPNYVLSKTFNLINKRGFVNGGCSYGIHPVTNELFIDISYTDNNSAYNPDGIADALESERISYKLNRTTLEIEFIYIGSVKANAIQLFANGDIVTSIRGDHNPTVPTSNGLFSLQEPSTTVINTGMVQVDTLKEINLNTGTPTGATKPNVVSDPDYITPYEDIVQCPITYNLDCPTDAIITVTTAEAVVEFGLGVQVTNNPVLAKVRAVFDVAGVQKGMVEWPIPNTPNNNAFFATVPLTGVSVGNVVDVSIYYLNGSNSIIGSCVDIRSYTATAP